MISPYALFIQRLLQLTLTGGLIILQSGCAVNPVSGKKQIALMSEEQEIALGKESDPQIVAEYGLYPDSNLQRFIRQKGGEMARISHRPNLNWSFRVLDSEVINAFAVPGGYVYFTRGILAHMNNEAQFAGVLGHEIGHVTARHSVSQQTKGLLTQLGLMVAIVANKDVAQFANELSQGAQLLMMSFSREHESQSDELGVEYSSKVGYDAKEMAKFFLTLQAQQQLGGHSALPEFMSTHPDPGNRFERVTQLANQYQQNNKLTNLKINRDSYLKLVEGIVYGEDPRQGFVENNVFYHPELKFQFNTPQGWQYKNSPTQVLFAPQSGDAMCVLSLAKGSTPQDAAQQFQQQYKISVSQQQATTINGLPAYVLQGDQVQQSQQGQQAQSVRLMAAFIRYGGVILQFLGVSTPQAFAQYSDTFRNQIGSFRQITDATKLNIKPERISLFKVSRASTFQQLLQAQGIPQTRWNEMVVLNATNLNANLNAGDVVKLPKRY